MLDFLNTVCLGFLILVGIILLLATCGPLLFVLGLALVGLGFALAGFTMQHPVAAGVLFTTAASIYLGYKVRYGNDD